MTAPAPAPATGARGRRPGLPLGRPFGVPVYLSPSWLVFAAAVTVLYGPELEQLAGTGVVVSYLLALGFAVLLGASVLAHEMSHLLAARGLGLPVSQITLFLLGGVTEIDEEPRTPAMEYLVAVAGPITSLFLAGTGAALATALPDGSVAQVVALLVALSNGLIVVFNLLPGLPLDGGRVLRAGVWRISGTRATGTEVAAQAGRVLAVVLIVAGIVVVPLATGTEPSLTSALVAGLLGAFIYASATQALQAGRMSRRLPMVSVRQLLRRPLTVPADLPLAEALRRAHSQQARGLVVVDSLGRPDGVVDEAAVAAVPEHRRPWVTVGELARRVEDGLVLRPDLAGEGMVTAMRDHPASEYLVVDSGGGVVGVVASADVARLLGLKPAR